MYQPWWVNDAYDREVAVPTADLDGFEGPQGVALVRAWKDGTTDAGWGLTDKSGQPAFIPLYNRKRFSALPILVGYEQRKWNFAFVMRSLKLICIDIDGKNDGILHAGKLGMLPLTLAETSKSGDGFHLWYSTPTDVWDDTAGFALFADRIGIEQGVDIRATGCVYHHPSQRWNSRSIVELPPHLAARLTKHKQAAAAQSQTIIKTLATDDPKEIVVMHDQLLLDLAKPIPAGRRNNTLFAIGQQLKLAQVPDWDQHLYRRALAVGLDTVEANKLVLNVKKYN